MRGPPGRAAGGKLLRPGYAVPGPGVVEKGAEAIAAVVASKQNNVPRDRIIRERHLYARGRTRRREKLRPGPRPSIPFPGIVKWNSAVVVDGGAHAAEQQDRPGHRVIHHLVARETARRRRDRRELLGPGNSVPNPRVVELVSVLVCPTK